MRVLVTGGAGYVGSVVISQLVEAGQAVVVYDNLSQSHPVRQHSPEAVMHFAASIEAGESMLNPAKFFRNNSANALTLLETMNAHNVRAIVFSSTAALYGKSKTTPIVEWVHSKRRQEQWTSRS